ncbi:MAG: hypothetical protein KAX19_04515, partial [Candidatus Brocadiae bacterium]|nr:hypothetical protein [Candidatus Brocadiia bacterium]
MEREGAPWGILDELAARIQSRCEEADRTGDQVGAARWRAMAAVVETKLIPLACPDAVTVAGDAARAALDEDRLPALELQRILDRAQGREPGERQSGGV